MAENVAPTIHFEHPDDDLYCLCGKLCNRNDSQTTRDNGGNVTCLKCLMLEEMGKKGKL